MEIAALLQLGLTLLPQVTTGVTEFIRWLESMKSVLTQSDEWTPELDAQWRAALFAKTSDPAYAPDPPEEA